MRLYSVLLALALAAGCSSSSPARQNVATPAETGSGTAPTAGSAETAPPSANPGINARYQTPEGRAASVKLFEEPERASFQKPDEVIAHLGIKKGETIADVATGSGYMLTRLSAAVGSTGKVYAEDIQAEFLEVAKEKITTNKLSNVEVILGTATDPKLPAGCCDRIIVLDAYHHFEWPEPMLATFAKALKPNGRLILVDFHRRPNPIFDHYKIDVMKHVRLDQEGVKKELVANGWQHVEDKDFLSYQFFSVFTRKSP